jgi:hypothetical protein
MTQTKPPAAPEPAVAQDAAIKESLEDRTHRLAREYDESPLADPLHIRMTFFDPAL